MAGLTVSIGTQHWDKQLLAEIQENQEQGVNFLEGLSTKISSAPVWQTLNQSQQGDLYPRWVSINKLGTWMMSPKLMSTEIYQNSLIACTGSHLSWKAVCEQINFSGSQTTAELCKQMQELPQN